MQYYPMVKFASGFCAWCQPYHQVGSALGGTRFQSYYQILSENWVKSKPGIFGCWKKISYSIRFDYRCDLANAWHQWLDGIGSQSEPWYRVVRYQLPQNLYPIVKSKSKKIVKGWWWPMQPMLAEESILAEESGKSSAKSSVASPQKIRQKLIQNKLATMPNRGTTWFLPDTYPIPRYYW